MELPPSPPVMYNTITNTLDVKGRPLPPMREQPKRTLVLSSSCPTDSDGYLAGWGGPSFTPFDESEEDKEKVSASSSGSASPTSASPTAAGTEPVPVARAPPARSGLASAIGLRGVMTSGPQTTPIPRKDVSGVPIGIAGAGREEKGLGRSAGFGVDSLSKSPTIISILQSSPRMDSRSPLTSSRSMRGSGINSSIPLRKSSRAMGSKVVGVGAGPLGSYRDDDENPDDLQFAISLGTHDEDNGLLGDDQAGEVGW